MKLFKKLAPKLNQPSTWRGICMLLTASGIYISPEHINLIATVGIGLTGAIGTFISDHK